MKKILLFILLSFFISSVSYSKIITLKDCYSEMNEIKSLDKNLYDEYKFVIDTDKKIVNYVIVWSDKEMKKNKQDVDGLLQKNNERNLGLNTSRLESLRNEKIQSKLFNIIKYTDDEVVAELEKIQGRKFRQSINVNLKKNTILNTTEIIQPSYYKSSYTYFCK